VSDWKDLVQVAGVIDQAEADMLVACGVRFLGFPLRLAVHKEDLTEAAAARIIRNLTPPARAVLITYLSRADEVLSLSDALGASIVQLHGDVDVSQLRKLKDQRPDLAIIKSLVVGLHPVEELLRLIEHTASSVDAYITDTFDPRTGATGATGKTHDWRASRQLAQQSPRPVILAGGLHPGTVRDAILEVRPAGVDAHTGLEDATGRKSEAAVKRFVREAEEAFRLTRECMRR
jgi:phosphoribosylanthranilate isomerase